MNEWMQNYPPQIIWGQNEWMDKWTTEWLNEWMQNHPPQILKGQNEWMDEWMQNYPPQIIWGHTLMKLSKLKHVSVSTFLVLIFFWINEWINQWINQLINQWRNELINELITPTGIPVSLATKWLWPRRSWSDDVELGFRRIILPIARDFTV